MEQMFKNWLIKKGLSETGGATSYSRAIHKISQHYSKNENKTIDIYTITNQKKISEISHSYSQSGIYSKFGYEQHSRFRNAIGRYSEFFVNKMNSNSVVEADNTKTLEKDVKEDSVNFAYERDLQTTLCAQISELFPKYKIYGNENRGIEYSIEGCRIDVLLEHIEDESLLVIELKSGVADYKVFGRISMYLGLLQNKFPNSSISGVIIAGAIHDGLRHACAITDKVDLMVYRMSLELENI
jgi:hypothetical protein